MVRLLGVCIAMGGGGRRFVEDDVGRYGRGVPQTCWANHDVGASGEASWETARGSPGVGT